MGKIRTIKPEFFRHEALFEAEQAYQLPLRLAFVGLFTCCDRDGRFRWRPRQLKLDIVPYDVIDFSRVLDALATCGFIVKYECDRELYGYIPSWHKHQQINHKESASRLPPPEINPPLLISPTLSQEAISVASPESVTPAARVLHASITHEETDPIIPGVPRGEMEEEMDQELEIEMEEEKEIKPTTHIATSTPDELNPIERVFTHWKHTMDHPKAVLDPPRRQLIRKALQAGYTVEQLCEAITGCSLTPHNKGENDRGQRYDGLHIIFRNADQIERFIYNAHHPPRVLNPAEKRLETNIRIAKNWLNKKLNEDASHE
jgi:hypothetical protein